MSLPNVSEREPYDDDSLAPDAVTRTADAWYAIWTHSHCEHSVAQQLSARGFQSFLPEMQTWSKRLGSKHLIRTPMFPGYLFVREALDKRRYIDMLKVRGIVRVLEQGWQRLTPVPDLEIDALQRLVEADLPVLPHAYLHHGDRVRVRAGALTGVEGVFIHDKRSKGRLVVSVPMLGRSVSVEVDCTDIEPSSSGMSSNDANPYTPRDSRA